MKRKIRLMYGIMICMFAVTFVTPVSAEPISQDYIINESYEGGITTYADVIEMRYRIYNGVYQRRRWNATKGKWVDPYWITV